MSVDEGKISSDGIQLHYIAEGPSDGEPVLLLHGFPQYSYTWRHQMRALAEAGYRAVALDLRGYNLSDRPEGVESYRMRALIGDIVAVYKAFGWTQANVVMHDWGGAIGWLFVTFYPHMVKKVVSLDAPHPTAFSEAHKRDTQQLQRGWYIWLFQIPDVPEQYFGGANIDRLITWVFQNGSKGQKFSTEDLARYRAMLSQPGQLTAALNYYRANTTPQTMLLGETPQLPPIQPPTLLIYGNEDFAFAPQTWEDTATYCAGPFRAVGLDGIGHWAAEEAPDMVNRLILEHVRS